MFPVAGLPLNPRQLHESKLLASLVLISIAPEAQWWLAPRFSVGNGVNNSQSAP
jgi:hypothetical protein